MDAHRDHYENTPYDLTKGLASGPFGTPNRYSPGAGEQEVQGNWERGISIPRTSDSFVVQLRQGEGAGAGDSVLWWGVHARDPSGAFLKETSTKLVLQAPRSAPRRQVPHANARRCRTPRRTLPSSRRKPSCPTRAAGSRASSTRRRSFGACGSSTI